MTRRLQATALWIVCLAATPTAHAQTSLAELGATNEARNEVVNRTANDAPAAPQPAPPAAQPAPVAAASQPGHGMKYTLSYALIAMLIGLGAYLVCRPSNRHEPD